MRDFLRKVPGYRSGKKWKSILATILYIFYFTVGLGANDPRTNDIGIILLQRFIPVFFVWVIFFNFSDLKSKLPLLKERSFFKKTAGILIILLLITPLSILILNQYKSPEYLENVRNDSIVDENNIAASEDNDNSEDPGGLNEENDIGDNQEDDLIDEETIGNEQADKEAEKQAEELAEKEELARKEAIEKEKLLKAVREDPSLISEEEYKNLSSDVAWEEVVSNPETYESAFLQKNLMVRQIVKDNITGELIYVCGEEKDDNVYTGGTFHIYDRRLDKSHEIQLYDKIYVYGVIDKVYKSWSAPQPHLYIGYLEYLGKFPED